jgi:1-pyrroline-4-hydroxy-2-carboxylate deaminase
MDWKGVMPAITSFFDASYNIDYDCIERHCQWLLTQGCSGVIALGTLGEGATLTFDEKLEVLSTCVRSVAGRAPVVAGISALSTPGAVELARAAADLGCNGLMILPPYVYQGDSREMKAHVAAVLDAVQISCMLYNNPVAYGTDFLPAHIQELAGEHQNLQAVKESSMDVRRVTAIRALLGDRLEVSIGVDDLVVEAAGVGASGWVSGLANVLPRESVRLFTLARNGERDRALELYRWFLPLLRMDTVTKFVQLIKLAQSEAGVGSARVRPPLLELAGTELQEARNTINQVLGNRPDLGAEPAVNATKGTGS